MFSEIKPSIKQGPMLWKLDDTTILLIVLQCPDYAQPHYKYYILESYSNPAGNTDRGMWHTRVFELSSVDTVPLIEIRIV